MATRWCFTLNNPTKEEFDQTQARTESFEFIICGLEHAPSTGTEHIQGYVELKNGTRQSKMETLISKRANFEPAKGTREDNIRYCSKENHVTIYFEKEKELTRAEIHYLQLLEATRTRTRLEIAAEFPKDFVLHHATVEKLITANRRTKPEWSGNLKHKNHWVVGKAGTGKSRWAAGIVQAAEQSRKNGNKWWDGYCSELDRAVIVEDMAPEDSSTGNHQPSCNTAHQRPKNLEGNFLEKKRHHTR
jgi:hypothetical protein